MADDSFEEKTEEPSPRKIQKAHEKGEFAKSREVNTVAIFLAIVLLFYFHGHTMMLQTENLCAHYLRFGDLPEMTASHYRDFMVSLCLSMFKLLAPVFLCVIAAGLAGNWVQIGLRFSGQPLSPKFDKLNPVNGFKKVFSLNSLVEGLKSIGKVIIVAWVAYLLFKAELDKLPFLLSQSVRVQIGYLFTVVLKLSLWVSLLMIIFALLDFWYQRYEWRKKLRMTKKEVQDEHKETEGNPLIKSRQRSLQLSQARKRMMQDVPKADVVITNPTEFAVALRYKHLEDRAPIVLAKGRRYLAQRIREIAESHKIPIVENVEVARGLYKWIPIGGEISGEFYKAVAQILAYVYKLKRKKLPPRKPVGATR